MSRRASSQSDSLEMLLDTMCNTFGGIILIALLIALLARDTKVSESETRQITESSGLLQRQVQKAEKDLAKARDFQTRLEQQTAHSAQASLLRQIEEREEVRRLSAALAEEIRTHDQKLNEPNLSNQARITDRILEVNARKQTAERELIEQRNLGESLQGKIEELKRGLQEESNRLAQASARQVQRLRLPREHETTKTHLYVIVRHGRLYPLYVFNNGDLERNTTSLRWEQETSSTRRVDPIPGLGLEPQANSPALTQFFRGIPGDRIYLVFQVFEDSFPAFNAAKEALVREGLEYTWEPRQRDAVLRLGPGAQAPPPQ